MSLGTVQCGSQLHLDTYNESEPLEVLLREHVDGVRDTVAEERLELVAKDRPGVGAPGEVGRRGHGRLRVAKDARPLLDGLVVVLRVDDVVDGAMVDLHLGPGAAVARVQVLGIVGPLLLRVDGLAGRAGRIPFGGLVGSAPEAGSRDTGVGNTGSKDVGVRRSQEVLHRSVWRHIAQKGNCRRTVIMAPEEVPVTYTLLLSVL